MSSLKHLFTIKNIPNNKDDENVEIFNDIVNLKYKCGCKKYEIEFNELCPNKSKCKWCDNTYCRKSIIMLNVTNSICIDCWKNNIINIILKNSYIDVAFTIKNMLVYISKFQFVGNDVNDIKDDNDKILKYLISRFGKHDKSYIVD